MQADTHPACNRQKYPSRCNFQVDAVLPESPSRTSRSFPLGLAGLEAQHSISQPDALALVHRWRPQPNYVGCRLCHLHPHAFSIQDTCLWRIAADAAHWKSPHIVNTNTEQTPQILAGNALRAFRVGTGAPLHVSWYCPRCLEGNGERARSPGSCQCRRGR